MSCRVVVVGNRVRLAVLLGLFSLPIHLFKDLLIEQFGLAPALPEPRPRMSPG